MFWSDLKRVLALAIPVALAELGWMGMGVVDTIMIGPLGPAAIGATGIGGNVFYSFAIFGVGMLFGLDTLVSQAFGAGNRADCHRSLMAGIYLALLLTPPLMLLFFLMPGMFYAFGIVPDVAKLAGQFVSVLSFGTLPLLIYSTFRRYLQSLGHVRPVMVVLITANVINALFNWLLIFGHAGLPRLGIRGSALSTCLARCYMAVTLWGCIWWLERHKQPALRSMFGKPDWGRVGLLIRIGAPAATQIVLEIGAFAAAGVLVGRLTPVALAAHQIALNVASVSYMVPLGISSAAAVAVGQAIGRRNAEAARRAGYISVGLGAAFMLCSAVLFLTVPNTIIALYSRNTRVLKIGVGLLAWAALFQLFDGIQTVSTGALRGLGQTRIPMLVNLLAYWLVGLPLGYELCFRYKYGVYGLWCGLTVSLIAIAVVLFFVWRQSSARLARESLKPLGDHTVSLHFAE